MTGLSNRKHLPGLARGYVSSLQYYPEFDTAIAFQTNTDIGIIDTDVPVILLIKNEIAGILVGKLALPRYDVSSQTGCWN